MALKRPLIMSDDEIEVFFAEDGNGLDGLQSSCPSDSLTCSDYPNCEWGGKECDGNHSYSPRRSEESVEGFVRAGEEDCVEQVPPPLSPGNGGKGMMAGHEESDSKVRAELDGLVVSDSELED